MQQGTAVVVKSVGLKGNYIVHPRQFTLNATGFYDNQRRVGRWSCSREINADFYVNGDGN